MAACGCGRCGSGWSARCDARDANGHRTRAGGPCRRRRRCATGPHDRRDSHGGPPGARRSQVRVLQGAPKLSIRYRVFLPGPVNNREQFAADSLDASRTEAHQRRPIAVPWEDGVGPNQHKCRPPVSPRVGHEDPEQPGRWSEGGDDWRCVSTSELLPESEVFTDPVVRGQENQAATKGWSSGEQQRN